MSVASAATVQGTAALSLRKLVKAYVPGKPVLRGIDLEFGGTGLAAIIGASGTGKSTLIRCINRLVEPTSGEILLEGQEVDIRNPKDSMRLGIETIYQYNSMVPLMTISRNVFIGREPLKWSIGGFGILDEQKMREESVKAIADVDLHLRSPDALVGELSGGQRQGVAIARAMHFKSKVMILDEPTNHLSVKETAKVIGFVKGLKEQGVTSVFISHNMHHVFACCDRIVAMALGQIVLDKPVSETSIEEVSEKL